MKKFVCTVGGYVYEGEAAPAECPVCHAPASKFKEQSADRTWAAEHVVGVAQGVKHLILLPCSVGNTIRCQQYLHRLDQEECRRPQDHLFHWQMD